MSALSALDNIRISKKFTIVMVLMFIPIVVLNYILITEKEVLIDFAKREIVGVHYLRPLHQFMYAVAKPTVNPAELAAAAKALSDAKAVEGVELDAVKETDEVLALVANPATMDAEKVAEALAALLGKVSDNSNIALDPDLNSYYIGNTIVNNGPNIVNRSIDVVSALRALLADANHSIELEDEFAIVNSQVQGFIDGTDSDLAKALTSDADGKIKNTLEPLMAKLDAAQDYYHNGIKARDLNTVIAGQGYINNAMKNYLAGASDVMEELLNARIAGFKGQIIQSLTIAGVLLAISVLMAIVIIRSITNPLGKITGMMGELTNGNLSIEVPKMTRGDEIGVLNRSLESMHESAIERQRAQVAEAERLAKEAKRAELIQNTIRQFESKIQGIVSTVAAAATELAHTAQQMTKIMKQASENTTNAVATASETAGNVSSVAAAAEEMAASVREISSQVQKTNELVKDSQGKTIAADEKAGALSEASAKVRDAVMLISTISSKINLLALNATIESARAGEAGRGFAVVASEVKVLANQTNQSLEDIGKVIEGMDSASSEITKALTNIKESVEQVSSASNSIAAAVEEQSATTNEITRNMQNAAQGTNLISDNLGTVNQSSGEATAAANEVLSAAEELSRQAEALNREVNDFLEVIKAA